MQRDYLQSSILEQSDRTRMGAFANRAWVNALAWTSAVIIVALNIVLAVQTISGWMDSAGRYRPVIWLVVIPVGTGLLLLLLWITLEPYITRRVKRYGLAPVSLPEAAAAEVAAAGGWLPAARFGWRGE